MKTYHVAKWNELYENNRSRKISDLRWIPIPNCHDGEKYSELITRNDGMELFAAWILILQVASRCAVRGSLVRSNGQPHDPASLSLKTRAPEKVFAKALPYLEQIGWLTSEVFEQSELPLERQSSASETSRKCHAADEEGKGIEGNGKEEKDKEPATKVARVFIPPSPEEVEAYSKEIGHPMDGAAWCDTYIKTGWCFKGGAKMKDWKATIRDWKRKGWVAGTSLFSAANTPQRDPYHEGIPHD